MHTASCEVWVEVPGHGEAEIEVRLDIDESLKKVEELGGTTVLGRQDVGGMGWAAYFKDVEGNLMGLWQSRQ